MNSEKEIKEIVKDKYSKIALQDEPKSCGCGCGSTVDSEIMSDNYDKLSGYVKEADLGLGCGLPTEFAEINEGNIVVDLGSGAGNDIFIVSKLVGENGKAIGIDFSPEMISKANRNKKKLGYTNVEFHLGEIENIPLKNNYADIVISNCVLNLVPNKENAFNEINRVLKPGGHFCISDIVLKGKMPEQLKQSAEMYAGCVSGAIDQNEYLKNISDSGFNNVEIKKVKKINLPEDTLRGYLNEKEISEFQNNEIGIFSITVVGYKN